MHSVVPEGKRKCVFSRVLLFVTPCTLAHQAPLPMKFSRQEHWSSLPFPAPGDLPNSGIKSMSLASPALAGGFFTTVPNEGQKNMETESYGRFLEEEHRVLYMVMIG